MRYLAIFLLGVGIALVLFGVLPPFIANPEMPLYDIPQATLFPRKSIASVAPLPIPQVIQPTGVLNPTEQAGYEVIGDEQAYNAIPRSHRQQTLQVEGTQRPSQTNYQPSIPVRLIIPAIKLDVPVSPADARKVLLAGDVYDQWKAPKDAAGWHSDSALLGEIGNTVLNGHNNEFGEVFKDLNSINPGDTILVYSTESVFLYVVTNKMILPEAGESTQKRVENASWIGESLDERLTLVTCWPYESNTHRLIIVAKPDK